MNYTIGVDFGGVLSKHDGYNAEHRNTAIDMPGANASILNLKKEGNKLYLVSYCGKVRAGETSTNIKKSSLASSFSTLFFVTDRTYKKYVCDFLGCDFMIDDNSTILDDVAEYNPKIITILFDFQDSSNTNKESSKPKSTQKSCMSWLSCCKRRSTPKKHLVAHNWQEVEDIIKRHQKVNIVPNLKVKVSQYCHHV